jgi:hypothetical protein
MPSRVTWRGLWSSPTRTAPLALGRRRRIDDANQRLQVVVRSDAAIEYGLENGIFPVVIVEFTT